MLAAVIDLAPPSNTEAAFLLVVYIPSHHGVEIRYEKEYKISLLEEWYEKKNESEEQKEEKGEGEKEQENSEKGEERREQESQETSEQQETTGGEKVREKRREEEGEKREIHHEVTVLSTKPFQYTLTSHVSSPVSTTGGNLHFPFLF